ncbi:MAG: hypothetical protein ACRDRH_29850, partial [Pseudonocardia sp.]
MARRIGGKGGGSDPGGGSGQTALLVGVLILALGAGGTASVGGGAGSSGLATPGASSAGRGGTKVSGKDSQAAKIRLARQGLRIDAEITDDASNCAEHAYGQVRAFLQERPCTALHRAQFQLRDRKGDVILVAVSWVQMPDEAAA